jgi:predicted small lipoprotein YifL
MIVFFGALPQEKIKRRRIDEPQPHRLEHVHGGGPVGTLLDDMNDNDPEPLVERTKTDPTCARLTWIGFHAFGMLLLYLSGNLPLWPEGQLFWTLAGMTTVLYIAAGLKDPGYLPPSDVEANPREKPLLELPQCTLCQAGQLPRAKVST